MAFEQMINNLSGKYAKPAEFVGVKVAYGTAGFRRHASELDWVLYRMGLLANLRSLCQQRQFIGCMITASHNPEEDNGCKLVDPLGDMLEEQWEVYATELVNSNDLKSTLKELCQTHFKSFIDEFDAQSVVSAEHRANVLVAHDTRASCPRLLDAFITGVEELNGNLINYGLLSTPQLHYMIRCRNTNSLYGEPTEAGYYQKLTKAFNSIWSQIHFKEDRHYDANLFVDGANGIGADKIKEMANFIKSDYISKHNNNINTSLLNIVTFNDGKNVHDVLNFKCGADHVKTLQKVPVNLPVNKDIQLQKYCSFDGDADRIVYYYNDEQNVFHLLDGDKIATLLATQMTDLINTALLSDRIDLCIVQTAYANGSSTCYIKDVMKTHQSCVPTGVKYLHHEAKKSDIGVYFEANGHGTITFSQKAEDLIEQEYQRLIDDLNMNETELGKALNSNSSLHALYTLKHLKDCINQTVGDAISDLLIIELTLALRDLSVVDWDMLYTDLPSRLVKVTIKDRSIIKTTDAERRVSEPIELQNAIDSLIESIDYKMARSFVRPSGTEDVVRVYAEADTQEHTDDLAKRVSQLVYDLAGGVGQRP